MSWFHLALLLHIVGVLGLISAMALVLVTALLLRRATEVTQVRDAAIIARNLPRLFGPSSALVLLSGIWLTVLRVHNHGSTGWIVVALVAFVLIGVSGARNGKRTSSSLRAAIGASKGTMTDELKRVAADRHLLAGATLNTLIFLGIVVLMIYQPSVVMAVVVLLVALVIGLAVAARAGSR